MSLRINFDFPIPHDNDMTRRHHPHSTRIQRQDSPRRLVREIDIGRRDFRVDCCGRGEGVGSVEFDGTSEDGDIGDSTADGEDPAVVAS